MKRHPVEDLAALIKALEIPPRILKYGRNVLAAIAGSILTRAKEATILKHRVEELEGYIEDFRSGNYLNPNSYQPHQCPHGNACYADCDMCDEEYWMSVIGVGTHSVVIYRKEKA